MCVWYIFQYDKIMDFFFNIWKKKVICFTVFSELFCITLIVIKCKSTCSRRSFPQMLSRRIASRRRWVKGEGAVFCRGACVLARAPADPARSRADPAPIPGWSRAATTRSLSTRPDSRPSSAPYVLLHSRNHCVVVRDERLGLSRYNSFCILKKRLMFET